ncbi:MAG: hypothetical protein R3B99_13060 [Polyangiales bacterium]
MLGCEDFGASDEHISLYFFDGAMTDVYTWPGRNGAPSYCPGGAAPA